MPITVLPNVKYSVIYPYNAILLSKKKQELRIWGTTWMNPEKNDKQKEPDVKACLMISFT
jgi:hypothetical protein